MSLIRLTHYQPKNLVSGDRHQPKMTQLGSETRFLRPGLFKSLLLSPIARRVRTPVFQALDETQLQP